jgi:hypothetical protein
MGRLAHEVWLGVCDQFHRPLAKIKYHDLSATTSRVTVQAFSLFTYHEALVFSFCMCLTSRLTPATSSASFHLVMDMQAFLKCSFANSSLRVN